MYFSFKIDDVSSKNGIDVDLESDDDEVNIFKSLIMNKINHKILFKESDDDDDDDDDSLEGSADRLLVF